MFVRYRGAQASVQSTVALPGSGSGTTRYSSHQDPNTGKVASSAVYRMTRGASK
ncbi:Uncharacterised protein [Mycobacteroides abscessus subsp. abscessus]|nr:Uncharacterised protein [Mycobacteroides abscessus subsp. abscessus]